MFNLWVIIGFIFKLVVVFGIVRWWLYRSRDTHAGRLARLICLAFLGVVLLPVGAITLPVVNFNVIPSRLWAFFDINVQQAIPLLVLMLMIIYLCGVFTILNFRFWHLLNALGYTAKAAMAPEPIQNALNALVKKYQINKKVCLKMVSVSAAEAQGDSAQNGPFTAGLINPVIVLPANSVYWSSHTLNRVLTHELTHISRNDWFWQNFLQCLTSFIWFLPSAWWLNKKFSWLCELNADDAVLLFDDNRAEYAKDLLNIANQTVHSAPAAMALIDGSYCYERIAAVLDGSRLRANKPLKHTQYWTWTFACCAWLALSTLAVQPSTTAASTLSDTQRSFVYVVNVQPEVFPVEGGGGANNPIVSKGAPNEIIETLVIIERDIDATKSQLAQGLRSELNQQLNENFKAVASVPNVKVHGYVAVRAAIPEYPKYAQRKNIEGQVIVQFDVLPSGKPDNIRIAMATPKAVFEKSVMEAMAKSIFKPAMANGLPVKTAHATQTFTFRLFEGAKPKSNNPQFGTPIKTASAEQSTHAEQ